MWDGDQTLYELRTKGDAADSVLVETESDTGASRGRTAYVHGGATDQPLVVYRYGASGNLTRVDGDKGGPVLTWTGSLLSGRADGSGLQYRRNRYYDPGSGRFTQADPIGLAGGPSGYGLAEGDPVNSTDAFGLSADDRSAVVQYDSPATKAKVEAARKINPAFDALWKVLDASPSVFLFFDRANYPSAEDGDLCIMCAGLPFSVDSVSPTPGFQGLHDSYPDSRGIVYVDSRRRNIAPLDSMLHHESVHLAPLAQPGKKRMNRHCSDPFKGVWNGFQNCPTEP